MKTPVELIQRAIFVIRGHKVMIDADLALLYKVPTKVLNQAVGRNASRFPADFMFRLTKEEKLELVTNCDRLQRLKHSSVMPRAFTEQGIGGDVTGKVAKRMLVLHGKCTRCGGAVARVIENEG
jgi:hypothetical protein